MNYGLNNFFLKRKKRIFVAGGFLGPGGPGGFPKKGAEKSNQSKRGEIARGPGPGPGPPVAPAFPRRGFRFGFYFPPGKPGAEGETPGRAGRTPPPKKGGGGGFLQKPQTGLAGAKNFPAVSGTRGAKAGPFPPAVFPAQRGGP